MKTLGQIKLSLMQNGVFIPEPVRQEEMIAAGCYTGKNGTEITFALGEDFYVKTFLITTGRDKPEVTLQSGSISIRSEDGEVAVNIVSTPLFLQKRQGNRNPVSQNISLDGNCLNLFLRAVGKKSDLNVSVENIISVVRAAFEEGYADLVQLNMDYCEEDDRGFKRLVPVVHGIKNNFSTFISLRGFPPKDWKKIDRIYAAGIDLVNFPLEGFAGTSISREIIQKEKIREALEYAASVFPQGAVSTELVFGSSDTQSVRNRIDRLTDKGIIPLLKLPNDVMGKDKDDYGRIVEIVKHLSSSAQRNKLNLKWLYPSFGFVTPLDSSFFTDDPASARLAVKPVYQSVLGKKASEGFTVLRRKLRVKNISDSYESAGL